LQPADESLPAAINFPLCEPVYVIEPVYCAVISEPVDDHQACLLRRHLLEQNIVAPHINAEDDQVIEQVLLELVEIGEKFRYRVTLFEMPPQGPGNTAIKIRDQINDKTFAEAGLQFAVILRNMLKISHVTLRQVLIQDEFAPGLLVALSFLDLDDLARILRVQVTGALLAYPDRFAG